MITAFAAAMTLAAHVWGMPACGQPTQAVEPYPADVVSSDVAETYLGWADVPGCRVVITPNGLAYEICTTVVHEWGHLKNGPGHSPDPNNVMSEGPGFYWRCMYGTNADPLQSYRHVRTRGWRRPSRW